MRWLLPILAVTAVSAATVVGGPGADVRSKSTCGATGLAKAALASIERRVLPIEMIDCDDDSYLTAPLALYALAAVHRVDSQLSVVHVLTDPFTYVPTAFETRLFASHDPITVWCLANHKIRGDAARLRLSYTVSRSARKTRGTTNVVQGLCLDGFGIPHDDSVDETLDSSPTVPEL